MTMGRKRVFHIIQSLDNGGCENMLLRTLPLVDEFEHTIITLKELGELAPRFASANIRVVTVHYQSFFDFSGLFRLRTLVKEEQPNLVLSYLFHADMITRFFLHDILPTPPIPFLRTTYNHPRYFIARLLMRLTRPLVKQYIANSEAVKRFYRERLGITSDNIQVLPNGIDTTLSLSSSSLKESLGIAPGETVIVCVANLHTNKGHTYLLEAFERVYQKYPNMRLFLIGDGEEKANLKKQIDTYTSRKHIFFLGKRTDVHEILQLSHIFVLPTLFEGMSNALMEAMAAGLPVITTDIEENRELVKDKETGILVPVKNSDTIADALDTLLANEALRSQIGQTAKKFIEENFSLKKIARDWNNLLAEYT